MSIVQDFLNTRKAGVSRESSADRLRLAAKLMGYSNAEAVDWTRWTRKEMMTLKSKLSDKIAADEYMPATANGLLEVTRCLMREAFEQELVSAEQFRRVEAVKSFPQLRTRNPRRVLTTEEMLRLRFAADFDLTTRGARDQALISLFTNPAGLRIAEYIDLRVSDIDLKAATLRVADGKNGKERTIPLTEYTTTRLAAWLEVLNETSGPLWRQVTTHGKLVEGKPALTSEGLKRAIDRLADKAQVKRFSIHAARRYAGTRIHQVTGSDVMSARLLGHSRGVTDRYVKVTLEELRSACEKAHIAQTWIIDLPTEPEPDDLPPAPPVGARLISVLEALRATY